jgi:hypothetical protein
VTSTLLAQAVLSGQRQRLVSRLDSTLVRWLVRLPGTMETSFQDPRSHRWKCISTLWGIALSAATRMPGIPSHARSGNHPPVTSTTSQSPVRHNGRHISLELEVIPSAARHLNASCQDARSRDITNQLYIRFRLMRARIETPARPHCDIRRK